MSCGLFPCSPERHPEEHALPQEMLPKYAVEMEGMDVVARRDVSRGWGVMSDSGFFGLLRGDDAFFLGQLDNLSSIVYAFIMKTIAVAELKAHFSALLKEIEEGNEIVVSFGRKKEKLAVIVPYATYMQRQQRRLGSLQGKGPLVMKGFAMDDEELLKS